MSEEKGFNSNFNGMMLVLLLFVIGANVWLVIKGIYTGLIYLSLFSGGIIGISVYYLFAKEDQQLKLVYNVIKSPFETSIYVGSLLFLLGIISRVILQLILAIAGGSFNSYSIPLFGNKLLSGVSQSFSVAQIESSNSWKIFNITINAGTSEEFIFAFILPVIFVAVLTLIIWGLKGKNSQNTVSFLKRYRVIILLSAIFVSVLIFVGLHSLNQTYDTAGEYLKAGLFRGLSMFTIYFNGLFFSFWVGFHIAHNSIWLITDPILGIGIGAFLQGMITGVGLILTSILLFSVGVVIFGWEKVKSDLKEVKLFRRG